MVETNVTCMQVVVLRVHFIDPMSQELSEEIIEGYMKIILKSQEDKDTPNWGNCAEKFREVEKNIYKLVG